MNTDDATMRLLVLSDLHVEIADFEPAAFDADLVVLAGDIHNGALAPRWARHTFPDHPILMIAGNHEFYDGERARVLDELRDAARESQVQFLENEETEIDGVRFLGCTLWTDYRAFEQPGRALQLPTEQAMAACGRMIADHFAIRLNDGQSVRAFSPQDAASLHAQSREWLEGALARSRRGTTVVVTHHLPSWRSVHPAFGHWVSNAGFVSDLDPLVGLADLWIHGHTHTSHRYRLGGAEVVCNPRGYPRFENPPAAIAGGCAKAPVRGAIDFENRDFDAAFVVEIRRRRA
jgi:predicted phosphodiesterase